MWDKHGWLNWFWQFLCEGLSTFNPKGFSYSHAWSCRVCEGRTSLCTGLDLKNLHGFSFAFNWLYFIQCLICFLWSMTFFIDMHKIDAISSDIDKVLSINPSGNVLVFGDFNVHHQDWLTNSFGFISFLLPQHLFYNGFLSIGKFWSCCCLSFHWLSNKLITRCPISLHTLWLFLSWLEWSSWSFERCSMGRHL